MEPWKGHPNRDGQLGYFGIASLEDRLAEDRAPTTRPRWLPHPTVLRRIMDGICWSSISVVRHDVAETRVEERSLPLHCRLYMWVHFT